MSLRDDPPDTPRCPRCVSATNVEPATDYELARIHLPWLCLACVRYFDGTLAEFNTEQSRKIADAAARGDLGQSGARGRRILDGET